MRVLLDTNVVISALLFGGTPRRLLASAIAGAFEAATSVHLLDELERLLEQKFGFSRAAAVDTRSELEALCHMVEVADVPRVCRDPDDDHVLAAATAAGADVIVTGDRDLLEIGSYQGIDIVTPAVFAKRLRA